eukprot:GEMP01004738.1.p1 GENE.GEMP01004738.1~~GEMP01004738.1.p1  ORF type:complete len:393 (+),score=54.34 GEMP01004738.1:184-1362(+)
MSVDNVKGIREVRNVFRDDTCWSVNTERTFLVAQLPEKEETFRAVLYDGKRRRSLSVDAKPLTKAELKELGVHADAPSSPNPFETEEEVMATLRKLWNKGEGFTYARAILKKTWEARIPPTSRVFAFFIKFLVREPHPAIHMDTIVMAFNRIPNPNIHTWSSLLRALGSLHKWDKVELCFHSCRTNIRENTKDYPYRSVLYQAAYEICNAYDDCPQSFRDAVYKHIREDKIKLRTPGDGLTTWPKENVAPRKNSDNFTPKKNSDAFNTKKLFNRTAARQHSDSEILMVPTPSSKRRLVRRYTEWPEEDYGYGDQDFGATKENYYEKQYNTRFRTPVSKAKQYGSEKVYRKSWQREWSWDAQFKTPSKKPTIPEDQSTGLKGPKTLRRRVTMK